MGEYDFSYEIPANFDNRVNQYLVQFGLGQLAEAFKQCKYGYSVVGLAFYVKLKGDD